MMFESVISRCLERAKARKEERQRKQFDHEQEKLLREWDSIGRQVREIMDSDSKKRSKQ